MISPSFFGELAAVAAEDALEKVHLGELGSLSGVEDYIKDAMSSFLDKYGPSIGAQLAKYAEPAARKAVEVVKPAVTQALKDYTPTFAAVVGGMVGLSLLLGVRLARRTIHGRRRVYGRRRRRAS